MLDRLIVFLRAVFQRLRPEGDLTTQTVKSGVWSVGLNVGNRGLQTLMVVILARILGPREFGLMGIALVTYEALTRFSRLGIDRALIQRPEANIDAYLDTAWAIRLARGVLLAALLFVGAPAIAWFFDEPRVTLIIRAIAISPILVGLFNPSVVYFQKDLDIHKKFAFDMSGAVAEFVVAVSIALVYESVWALVVGFIVTDVARLVASYVLHDYRPGLGVDRDQVRELVGYGKWITGSSAISFLLTSGDDAVVGRLVSTTALGYYQLGYRLAKRPTMEISRALSTVAFPVYSKLQGDPDALASALRRAVRVLSFASFPAAVGIAVTAPSFVAGVLGSQWEPVVPVMQIVAVYGAFSAFTSVFNDVWNAIGRPDLNTKINAVRLVVTALLVIPATLEYGFVGTVAVIAGVFVLLVVPIKLHVAVRCVETTHRTLLVELLYPAVASGVMGAVLLAVRRAVDPGPAVVEFVFLVVLGVVVYLLAVAVLDARSGWKIGSELDTVIGSIRG